MVRTGLEIFCDNPTVSGPVGLLTTVSSQTSDGVTAFDALRKAGVQVAALFSPEHGYFGVGAAGESISDTQDETTPIYSLYGKTRTPAPEILRILSAFIIDLQDTGNRWYTYAATMRAVLKSCAGVGVPVIVLDRPNPQGGLVMEGNIAEPEHFSLVSPAAIPVRYGLTFGELAKYFNDSIGADLFVNIMDGWTRGVLWNETGRQWVSPSPNMPHADTALLYTGTCLLEGTNISEGRGTALPFEQLGAPFVRGRDLAARMNALRLPGLRFVPVWFAPAQGKHAGQRCEGVRIGITEPRTVRGFEMGLHLIQTLRELYPQDFTWTSWDGQRNNFDTLTACTWLRDALEAEQAVAEIIARCEAQRQEFSMNATGFWLYGE